MHQIGRLLQRSLDDTRAPCRAGSQQPPSDARRATARESRWHGEQSEAGIEQEGPHPEGDRAAQGRRQWRDLTQAPRRRRVCADEAERDQLAEIGERKPEGQIHSQHMRELIACERRRGSRRKRHLGSNSEAEARDHGTNYGRADEREIEALLHVVAPVAANGQG